MNLLRLSLSSINNFKYSELNINLRFYLRCYKNSLLSIGLVMTTHEILDNINHKDIKVITDFNANFSEQSNSALIFPNEIKDAQRDYPILLIKNPETGQFQSAVLLGLVANENLFINNGWQASYVPAIINRGPFTIGFEEQEENGQKIKQAKVAIDTSSPRVNKENGEAVFMADGQASPYLNQINQHLKTLHEGAELNNQMFTAFLKHDLIEPITLNIELNSGEKITIAGNYTLNEDKLAKLSGEALDELHSTGFLRVAYFITSSLGNVQRLIDLKNKL